MSIRVKNEQHYLGDNYRIDEWRFVKEFLRHDAYLPSSRRIVSCIAFYDYSENNFVD